jgi:arylformamidase
VVRTVPGVGFAVVLLAIAAADVASAASSGGLHGQADGVGNSPPHAVGPVSRVVRARVIRDVPYGPYPLQRFDVYLPSSPVSAPVIFMVHGGAWAFGDKASRDVVDAKVARWVARGFVFVSVDYRLLPSASPLDQARDVARALAAAQVSAPRWGADPARFIVMGHSAGAHLVALVTASVDLRRGIGPWLGTVLLDSAALDVPRIMKRRHLPLYDRAFGADPGSWVDASPWHALAGPIAPVLAVCSTRRANSCSQAEAFAARAERLGSNVSVLHENLSHMQINRLLGEDNAYTLSVEAFLRRLDPSVARRLR